MELEIYQKVAMFGFLGAMLFGAMAYKTSFCIMGSISDWINMGSTTRFRIWMLSIGVALLATQGMRALGWFDLQEVFYLSTNFTWLGYVFGGFLFGVGMTMGSGCGQRTLVRVGGGNLKSLVLLLVMALTAFMTLRGLLAYFRIEWIHAVTLDLAESGLADQSIPGILSHFTGLGTSTSIAISALVLGLGTIVYAFRDRALRSSAEDLFMGFLVGILVAGAWYVTGVIGNDEFDPVPLESITFISPSGNTLSYLMTYTGATINFGIAVVLGMIAGAFVFSIVTGKFRIEGFANQKDLINHLIAGVLMGFGGVLSFGCTIGQGVTGMSTLALGSLMALLSIFLGCAVCLKMEYYLMDEKGWLHAMRCTATDFNPLTASVSD